MHNSSWKWHDPKLNFFKFTAKLFAFEELVPNPPKENPFLFWMIFDGAPNTDAVWLPINPFLFVFCAAKEDGGEMPKLNPTGNWLENNELVCLPKFSELKVGLCTFVTEVAELFIQATLSSSDFKSFMNLAFSAK